jgi:roadblock/LC7 domain-containing protein
MIAASYQARGWVSLGSFSEDGRHYHFQGIRISNKHAVVFAWYALLSPLRILRSA